MKIEELLFNNQMVNRSFSIVLIIYMVVIFAEAIIWIKKADGSQDIAQHENKPSLSFDLISLQALSVIIVYLITYIVKIRWLWTLVILSIILKSIFGFFESANKVYISVEKDEKHLSLQAKASLFVVAIYCFSFSAILPQSIRQITIDKDIYIILVKVMASFITLFAMICVTGLLIGELAYIIHGKKKWERIHKYGIQNKTFQEITIVPIWNKVKEISSKFIIYIRIPFIMLSYGFCLLINIAFTVIYLGQEVLQLGVLISAYICRFFEFLADKVYKISDSQYIWATIRLSIILSLILTESTLMQSNQIQNKSKEVFDYVSGAVLIPLIISEILSIKEKFKED